MSPTTISGTMPDVVGKPLATAESDITNAARDGTPNFTVNYADGGTPNIVASTTPRAGETITATVTIVVYRPAR